MDFIKKIKKLKKNKNRVENFDLRNKKDKKRIGRESKRINLYS
jgi:hypothetical protein